MGGPGSGNFTLRMDKKAVVEDCLSIDANRWMKEGVLRAGVSLAGECRWSFPANGHFTIRFTVNTQNTADRGLWLSYAWHWRSTGQRDSADYAVGLAVTRPYLGGVRWWFLCPLGDSGSICGRRVGKLYLPPGVRLFGCRHCHQLTYLSSQETGKFDCLFRRIAEETGHDFATVKQEMQRSGKWYSAGS